MSPQQYTFLAEDWDVNDETATFCSPPKDSVPPGQAVIFTDKVINGSISASITAFDGQWNKALSYEFHECALMFRYANEGQFYVAGIGGFGQKFYIAKSLQYETPWQLLEATGSAHDLQKGKTYHLRIGFVDEVMTLFSDGEAIISVTDDSYTSGVCGLRTNRTQARFESVEIIREDRKNPFPMKGVTSLVGATEQRLRTLPTSEFVQAARLATKYLDDGLGQIVTVSGSYGSGKTHLIHYTMDAVRENLSSESNTLRTVQVYAKTENPEFVSLYRDIVRQIDYPLLREVSIRFLGLIAKQELEKPQETPRLEAVSQEDIQEASRLYAEGKEQATKQLEVTPEIVFSYLDNFLIQSETVLDQRGLEVREIAGENFKKALFYLDDFNIGKIAYRWFVLDEVSDTDLQRLGVSSTLKTADEAKHGLRLLVTLFRHAGIRLMVYIDQIEKLLVGTDRKTSAENAGQLHSLAEFFPREKAFLLLSGADEGWQCMRQDFWDRIGPTKIVLQQITIPDSRDLIKLYLSQDETYSPWHEAREIRPFTLPAVDTVLRLRGGNMRRFLQTCHDAYQTYVDEQKAKIDEEVIHQVVTEEKEYITRNTVEEEIRIILRRKKLPFRAQVTLANNFSADFVVGDESRPNAVIEISDSLFYVDEARSALDIVRASEYFVTHSPQTRLIVIVMGYVSSEVLTELKKTADDCLIYDGEGFTVKFEAIIDSLFTAEELSPSPEVDKNIKQDLLEGVKGFLDELLISREGEMQKLNERLEALLRTQTEEREKSALAQHQLAWRNWLRQDQERWERRQADLKRQASDERKRLQQEGERTRWKQTVRKVCPYLFSIIGMALIVNLVISGMIPDNFNKIVTSEPRHRGLITLYEHRGLISLGIGFFMAIAIYFLFLRRIIFPLGPFTNEIANFTGDLSQLTLRARTAQVSIDRTLHCLENPNPLIRYFAAQVLLVKNPGPYVYHTAWINTATSETWIPLYVSYLKLAITELEFNKPQYSEALAQLVVAFREHIALLLDTTPDDPRIVYAISLFNEKFGYLPGFESIFSGRIDVRYGNIVAHAIFERFVNPDFFNSQNRDRDTPPLVNFARAYRGIPPNRVMYELLVDRFQNTGQFWDSGINEIPVLDLSEDELRLIIESLSPHSDYGLASFQGIAIANLYLRLYRFFAEIEWRVAHGDVSLK